MNPYRQRGRQDQRQDDSPWQGDHDRPNYGAQSGSYHPDRSREEFQPAYQGSSFQADRDEQRSRG